MNVSSGYRKNGFDAYGGAYLRKEDMAYWMDSPARTDPQGVALGLDEEIKEVEFRCQNPSLSKCQNGLSISVVSSNCESLAYCDISIL